MKKWLEESLQNVFSVKLTELKHKLEKYQSNFRALSEIFPKYIFTLPKTIKISIDLAVFLIFNKDIRELKF